MSPQLATEAWGQDPLWSRSTHFIAGSDSASSSATEDTAAPQSAEGNATKLSDDEDDPYTIVADAKERMLEAQRQWQKARAMTTAAQISRGKKAGAVKIADAEASVAEKRQLFMETVAALSAAKKASVSSFKTEQPVDRPQQQTQHEPQAAESIVDTMREGLVPSKATRKSEAAAVATALVDLPYEMAGCQVTLAKRLQWPSTCGSTEQAGSQLASDDEAFVNGTFANSDTHPDAPGNVQSGTKQEFNGIVELQRQLQTRLRRAEAAVTALDAMSAEVRAAQERLQLHLSVGHGAASCLARFVDRHASTIDRSGSDNEVNRDAVTEKAVSGSSTLNDSSSSSSSRNRNSSRCSSSSSETSHTTAEQAVELDNRSNSISSRLSAEGAAAAGRTAADRQPKTASLPTMAPRSSTESSCVETMQEPVATAGAPEDDARRLKSGRQRMLAQVTPLPWAVAVIELYNAYHYEPDRTGFFCTKCQLHAHVIQVA